MTDRVQSIHVTLDKERRTDDVEVIVNAIRMIKGVASVELGEPINLEDHLARTNVFHEFSMVVMRLLHEARDNSDAYKQIEATLTAAAKKRGYG